jgi:4-hydroxybenzoate polyprenyltransferase
MRVYLAEMFPLPRHALMAGAAGLGIAGYVRTIQGLDVPIPAVGALAAGWGIFTMLLILRLMDEIKDRDIDRALFPERPLPSGRVLESDIRLTLALATAGYLLPSLRSPQSTAFACLTLGYALLMLKRFFAPERLKRSLPITLATHTPVVPLLYLQAFVAVASHYGVALAELRWPLVAAYVGMLWLATLGWEISRKIRCPQEETAYVTYSQLLGKGGAVAAAALVQTMALGIGAGLQLRLGPGAPYLALMALGWAAACAGHLRFLLHPSPRTSRLRGYATGFVLALLAAQVYGFVLAPPRP